MRHDIELAYLGLEVPDPASLSTFFADVVGLVPGEPTTDAALTWRNDDRVQRIVVAAGPANDASFVGVEANDEATFAATAARLAAAGFEVRDGSDGERAARRVADLKHTVAPWGVRVELVHGLAAAGEPYASKLVPGGFLTEGVGFGHVVFATTAFDESHHFLTEALGMAQSDWLATEIMEGIELEVRFYHCNERHHSVALARSPFDLPQRLHHVMVEVNDVDDVGAAYDRALGSGLAIANGLGRHDNDGMFSFYVVSPAGFQVEVGHGARRITDGWDDNRRYDRISRWGHQPVPATPQA